MRSPDPVSMMNLPVQSLSSPLWLTILFSLLGFCLGAIPFSLYLTRWAAGRDIRQVDAATRERLYAGWKKAVTRTFDWAA